MLFGIFDIYNISEYYGYVDTWLNTFFTAVLSGCVAFLAARFQITNQKKHEIEIRERDNRTKKDIILDSTVKTIEIIKNDLPLIQKYRNKITEYKKDITINFFSNPAIEILLTFAYKDMFEVFKSKIETPNSDNIVGFRNFYFAVLKTSKIYEMINREISEFFSMKDSLSQAIEDGNASVLLNIKLKQTIQGKESTPTLTSYSNALSEITGIFFEKLIANENDNFKNRTHDVYEAFYWELIAEFNKEALKQVDDLDLRKIVITEIEKIRNLKFLEDGFKVKLDNRKMVLNMCKNDLEVFAKIFTN